MNDIEEKQNEQCFLMLQYAARYYYNNAEVINYWVWAICILNILLVSLPFDFLDKVKVITFILSIASIVIQLLVTKYTTIAASMRKYADYFLFGFNIPSIFNNYTKEELVELSIQVKNKNPKKAVEEYESSGSDPHRGVKDWYVDVNPNANKNEAILYCQKQNTWWDKKLSNIYINILIVVVAISILALIIAFVNRTLLDMIYFIPSISGIIIKTIWECIKIKNYREASISIDTLIKTSLEANEDLLMLIQNKIDQRRSMPFLSINFLHKITAKQYHKTIHDRNTMI